MRILALSSAAIALFATAACSSSARSSSEGSGGVAGGGNHATSSSTGGGGGAGGGSSSSTTSSSGTGGGAACVDPPDPQAFEMGTGETCFARLTSGQTVTVMQGPQGGYHLWLSFGCQDCGPQAILQYGIKDPITHDWYASTYPSQVVVPIAKSGWYQQSGFTDFLPGLVYAPESVLPKGTHVLMAAALLDAGLNVKHSVEVPVVLGDTMMWSPPCDTGPNCGTPGGLPCCSDGMNGGAPDGGAATDGGAGPDAAP
ncbi:Hypothetical protein A7982_08528 [Minicystis rosea]|nr:Hypothetical protein A7982_08528 [Minicystis rosea]